MLFIELAVIKNGGLIMKKLVKRILGAIVIASIMFSVMPGINVSAITGYHPSSMISPCPYCKVRNISYGVMRDFSGTSQTFHEGKYCEVCKRSSIFLGANILVL